MIPPEQDGSFVANMEMVLDIYKRPFDSLYPVVCMDESPKQLIAETRVPIPAAPGEPAKHDYEFARCGVCNVFLACEPLAGKRTVKVTERRTRLDWACFIQSVSDEYESAEKITLVMDNLNTHTPGSLYESFSPNKAKAMSVIPEKINIIVLSEMKRFNSTLFFLCLVYRGVFLVLSYL